jgi:NAD(P)-dependent dehydrogenase (short-subunit alcohol dehydrogenase family)
MSTSPLKHVLVVGASRGIGLEFVRQYRADGVAVTGTARDTAGLQAVRALGANAVELDIARLDSAAGLAWRTDGQAYDAVLLCAGVYGPRSTGLQAPSQQEFDAVMHTNVLGAMRVIPQLSGALAPGAKLVVLSSLMGAIGPRTGGGGWLYRASKAALNSVMKDASLALAGRAVCVSVHPGWVRTDMGGAEAALDVADSVADLRRLVARLAPADNGGFFNHDGTPIGW